MHMTDSALKLRKKLRSYRSARVGCIFLSVVSIIWLALALLTGQMDTETLAPAYASTFFMPALAYICHLKMLLIRHKLDADQTDTN